MTAILLAACDYFKPDPLPPRGDEWVIDAIRRQAAGASGTCRDKHRFYRDADGDGFGDPGKWVEGCMPPTGYVQNDEDCYDDNPNAYPGQTESFAKDRGDGSFDYDCDGKQSKRMTNRAYCIEKEDGSGCRSASGWLSSKIPKCGQPGRWKWYECVTILYRPETEQPAPSGAKESTGGGGQTHTPGVGASSAAARPAALPHRAALHRGAPHGASGPGALPGGQAAPVGYKKRFVCKGRELPWKKRQLCR